ncbi:MAG: CoA pyrophosphatase [Chloroflexi bacterium]|nr:CoA pyrophosphatase [Chloroflexota bacterium]
MREFEPLTVEAPEARAAAVGVVVLPDEKTQPAFILTRRVTTLRRHSGQWALPGGRLDPGESDEQAVLREIHEEIGLKLSSSDVLGRLDDFLSRSGHLMTPFVLWSSDSNLSANPHEVDAAFKVPLDDLDRDGNPNRTPLLSFNLVNSTVYAPTAAILFQFREVALHGKSIHLGEVEQPPFAWR